MGCPTVCDIVPEGDLPEWDTRAGAAAERRPIGKRLRRRKNLGMCAESTASDARFVGHCVLTSELIEKSFLYECDLDITSIKISR